MYNILDWIEKLKVEKAYFVKKQNKKNKTFKQVKTRQKDNKLRL